MFELTDTAGVKRAIAAAVAIGLMAVLLSLSKQQMTQERRQLFHALLFFETLAIGALLE